MSNVISSFFVGELLYDFSAKMGFKIRQIWDLFFGKFGIYDVLMKK